MCRNAINRYYLSSRPRCTSRRPPDDYVAPLGNDGRRFSDRLRISRRVKHVRDRNLSPPLVSWSGGAAGPGRCLDNGRHVLYFLARFRRWRQLVQDSGSCTCEYLASILEVGRKTLLNLHKEEYM